MVELPLAVLDWLGMAPVVSMHLIPVAGLASVAPLQATFR
jgi:hypothetical protein